MHPIERLRYVARASGADQADLVVETARALTALGFDPAGLVTACRRILDRQPGSGPMWWLTGRMLTSLDPRQAAQDSCVEITSDATVRELAHALPQDATVCVVGWPELAAQALVLRGDLEVLVVDAQGEGPGLCRRLAQSGLDAVDVSTSGIGAAAAAADIVLVEAAAVGPEALLAIAGSLAVASVGRASGASVWAVAGVGRLLPGRVWEAAVTRVTDQADPWDLDDDVVPLELIDRVCGPAGLEDVADALRRIDCPIAPELLK